MKTVRLKDRMWFGKYKGARISDVILKDKKILDELCSKGLIEYDEKVLKFIKQNYERNEKKSLWGAERYRNPYELEDVGQRIPQPEAEIVESENLSFQQRMERADMNDRINREIEELRRVEETYTNTFTTTSSTQIVPNSSDTITTRVVITSTPTGFTW